MDALPFYDGTRLHTSKTGADLLAFLNRESSSPPADINQTIADLRQEAGFDFFTTLTSFLGLRKDLWASSPSLKSRFAERRSTTQAIQKKDWDNKGKGRPALRARLEEALTVPADELGSIHVAAALKGVFVSTCEDIAKQSTYRDAIRDAIRGLWVYPPFHENPLAFLAINEVFPSPPPDRERPFEAFVLKTVGEDIALSAATGFVFRHELSRATRPFISEEDRKLLQSGLLSGSLVDDEGNDIPGQDSEIHTAYAYALRWLQEAKHSNPQQFLAEKGLVPPHL